MKSDLARVIENAVNLISPPCIKFEVGIETLHEVNTSLKIKCRWDSHAMSFFSGGYVI